MKLIRTYALVSMAVGVFQGLLGLALNTNYGAVNAIRQPLAILELGWIAVSMAVIVFYQQKGVRFLTPFAYLLFNLGVASAGAVVWILGGGQEFIALPGWFSAGFVLFGCWFGLINHRLYCRLNATGQLHRRQGAAS